MKEIRETRESGESYLILRRVRILEKDGKGYGKLTDLLLSRPGEGRGDARGDARILRIAPKIYPENVENGSWSSFDAGGAVLAPAFADSFCRFGSDEYFYREDPQSGGSAARAGGFGTLFLFPQNIPGSKSELSGFCRRLGELEMRFHPAVSLGSGRAQDLMTAQRPSLLSAGQQILLTDAPWDTGRYPGSARKPAEEGERELLPLMRLIAEEKIGAGVCGRLFCMGNGSPKEGVMNEGKASKLMGLPGIPAVYERMYVASRLLLSEASGCPVHFPIVSEAGSISMIRQAKREGIPVTCGTSPLYFSMTENDIIYRGSSCKLEPPLRTERDRQAVIEGLADGTVDCICSGHTPLSSYEKQGDLRKALPGAATLETVFSLGMTYLVESGALSFGRFLQCLIDAPLSLVRKTAAVAEGESGDLVLLDPGAEVICSDSTMKSRARNTPCLGMALRGRVKGLLLGGRFVYRSAGDV